MSHLIPLPFPLPLCHLVFTSILFFSGITNHLHITKFHRYSLYVSLQNFLQQLTPSSFLELFFPRLLCHHSPLVPLTYFWLPFLVSSCVIFLLLDPKPGVCWLFFFFFLSSSLWFLHYIYLPPFPNDLSFFYFTYSHTLYNTPYTCSVKVLRQGC